MKKHAHGHAPRAAHGAVHLLAVLVVLLGAAPPAIAQESPSGGSGSDVRDTPAEPEDPADARRREREQARESRQARKEAKRERERLSREQRRRHAVESSGRTALQWFEEARGRYERGKYLAAREILLPLEDSLRAVDIQEQVKLLIADTYFYQGGSLNLAEALARYRSFLTFFPQSPSAEYAQFQVANCYFRQLGPPDRDQSYTENAITEYERFLDLHPGSQWEDEARANMLEARALKARHEYQVATFYWNWRDHDAAVGRLEEVLREHPELPEREEALFRAAQAHYVLGNGEEGDGYAARLREDYPGSSFVRQLKPGESGARAARREAKREHRREKESDRRRRRQAARDRRRTRQIRRDSGLPRHVPSSPVPVAAASLDAAAAAPARADGRAARRAEAEAERMQRAEEREQRQAQRRAEQEERQEAKRRRKAERQEQERQRREERRSRRQADGSEPADGGDSE